MPLAQNTYDLGTISVENGSTAVSGTGTSWKTVISPGDVLWAYGISVGIESISDNSNIVLNSPWPADDITTAPYEIRVAPPSAALTIGIRKFVEETLVKESGIQAIDDAASIIVDLSEAYAFSFTLSGNHAVAVPLNIDIGDIWTLQVTQDGTGNRTLTYDSTYKWPGGTAPTLSTTAGALDILTFTYDGIRIVGSLLKDVR